MKQRGPPAVREPPRDHDGGDGEGDHRHRLGEPGGPLRRDDEPVRSVHRQAPLDRHVPSVDARVGDQRADAPPHQHEDRDRHQQSASCGGARTGTNAGRHPSLDHYPVVRPILAARARRARSSLATAAADGSPALRLVPQKPIGPEPATRRVVEMVLRLQVGGAQHGADAVHVSRWPGGRPRWAARRTDRRRRGSLSCRRMKMARTFTVNVAPLSVLVTSPLERRSASGLSFAPTMW